MPTIETMQLWIGGAVCVTGGVMLLVVLLYWLACASNCLQHKMLESYGGWKVFLEFRDWYRANNRPKGK